MSDSEYLSLLQTGVKVWNRWRSHNPDIRPDFSDLALGPILDSLTWTSETPLDLRHMSLRGIHMEESFAVHTMFDHSDLSGAFMEGASLSRCSFRGADLSRAHLDGAELVGSDLSGAILNKTDLNFADLRYATLSGSTLSKCYLEHAFMTEVDIDDCSFVECKVFGASAWGMKGNPRRQQGLIITRYGQPVVEVDDIRVAQFVHLILEHEHIRGVFNAVTQRGVLLLGRFGGGGVELLRSIANFLREQQYLPIIFDFERPRDRNYTETIKTLAGLSRFVIVDLSGPSVPQELYAIVPHFKIPFVPILEKGRNTYSMFADLLENDSILRPILEFEDEESLFTLLSKKGIKAAERHIVARQENLQELFNPQVADEDNNA